MSSSGNAFENKPTPRRCLRVAVRWMRQGKNLALLRRRAARSAAAHVRECAWRLRLCAKEQKTRARVGQKKASRVSEKVKRRGEHQRRKERTPYSSSNGQKRKKKGKTMLERTINNIAVALLEVLTTTEGCKLAYDTNKQTTPWSSSHVHHLRRSFSCVPFNIFNR